MVWVVGEGDWNVWKRDRTNTRCLPGCFVLEEVWAWWVGRRKLLLHHHCCLSCSMGKLGLRTAQASRAELRQSFAELWLRHSASASSICSQGSSIDMCSGADVTVRWGCWSAGVLDILECWSSWCTTEVFRVAPTGLRSLCDPH